MRCWIASKRGRPSSPNPTISPSRIAARVSMMAPSPLRRPPRLSAIGSRIGGVDEEDADVGRRPLLDLDRGLAVDAIVDGISRCELHRVAFGVKRFTIRLSRCR